MRPETSTRKLRGPAVIVLEQAAEPRLAADRREAYRRRIDWLLAATLLWDGQLIVDPLMRSFFVVVFDKLADEIVQIPPAEAHEVIEAFLAKCLDEPFDEGAGVRRAKRGSLDPAL